MKMPVVHMERFSLSPCGEKEAEVEGEGWVHCESELLIS